jgi:cytochrome c biogenesis protein CcmG/thiol:disulfide interchange protein DsbE
MTEVTDRASASVPSPAAAPARRRHTARWVALAAGLALVVLAVVLATRPPYQATEVDGPLVGTQAPAFHATQLDGSPLSLHQFRGHWVYVNFFASWCAPCQAEEPNLVQFSYEQAHQPGGAAVVSVVFQDSDGDARAFDQSQGATWPVVADPGGAIANLYGVSSPPTTFLIDPHGRVVGEFLAPVTVNQLDNLLAQQRAAEAT